MELSVQHKFRSHLQALTLGDLLDIIEHKIHELVVALERSGNCMFISAETWGRWLGNSLSLPPLNFTVIALSTYFCRSMISFF
jgi:hypothetical protein